jgi:hypothetical protein
VENSTQSSRNMESQKKTSNSMDLIKRLYEMREMMPMQAEPDELDQPMENENGTTTKD